MVSSRNILLSLALAILAATAVHADEIALPDSADTPGKVHMVTTGDTLWDIADAYLEDPFLWPKVWGENGQVYNPDLIYPGGTIRIPVALLKPEIREQILAEAGESPEMIEVRVPVGMINPLLVEAAGYVAERLQPAGKVLGMHEEHFLLGQDDMIFLDLKRSASVEPGTRYQVIRPVRKVRHPQSHKKVGTLVYVLGLVTIEGKENKVVKGHVDRSFNFMSAGDLVVPYVEPETVVSTEMPNANGVIVAVKDDRTIVGSEDVVYLDRGARDGLQPGMVMDVVRDGSRLDPDGVWGSYKLPDRSVATLKVLSVREGNATAQLQDALESIQVGDRFASPPALDQFAQVD